MGVWPCEGAGNDSRRRAEPAHMLDAGGGSNGHCHLNQRELQGGDTGLEVRQVDQGEAGACGACGWWGLGCVARLAWRLWAPLELGTPAPRPHEGGAGLSLQGEAPWAERGWTGAGHPHWPTRGPRGFRESQQKNNTLNALCGSCFQNLTRREALGSRWRTSLAWNALESQKRPTPRFGDSTLKAEGGEAEPGRQGGREATGAVRRTD